MAERLWRWLTLRGHLWLLRKVGPRRYARYIIQRVRRVEIDYPADFAMWLADDDPRWFVQHVKVRPVGLDPNKEDA